MATSSRILTLRAAALTRRSKNAASLLENSPLGMHPNSSAARVPAPDAYGVV
jgi:hypothetical protein